jgi:hypothetical protein
MPTSSTLFSNGHPLELSDETFGEIRSSTAQLDDPAALRANLAEDGYLYIPGFFDRDEILAVREEFLRRLRDKGALHPDYPEFEGIASPEPVSISQPEAIRGNEVLRKVVFSRELMSFYERLFGGQVRAYDHIWIRLIRPGKGTAAHCDLPYMGRGTHNVMTAWIPYRDTSLDLGGLIMLEKSHLQADRIRKYLNTDADTFCVNRNAYRHTISNLSSNPVSLREKFGGRWLTTEFRAGDLLTFGMTLIHASLDNQTNAYRMSTDTRYQLASEPIDERWVGNDTVEWAEKNRKNQIC